MNRPESPTLTPAAASELFRRPPDRMIDVGAGEVALRTVGSGPHVLLVHGWPLSGATYRGLLPHLVDHVTCHVIDLPGAGSSRFDATTELSVARHTETVRRVIDHLTGPRGPGAASVAVVGHDSGGLFVRHAVAGDGRVHGVGLIDTEQPTMSLRFRAFIGGRRIPGYGAALRWTLARPRLRRLGPVLGAAFADPSNLDGEFDEFFLRPLVERPERFAAAVRLLRAFDLDTVRSLDAVHRRISCPVQLVWGEQDRFFPVAAARTMAAGFPEARLTVVPGAGLMSQEEQPAAVARALLPVLAGPA